MSFITVYFRTVTGVAYHFFKKYLTFYQNHLFLKKYLTFYQNHLFLKKFGKKGLFP